MDQSLLRSLPVHNSIQKHSPNTEIGHAILGKVNMYLMDMAKVEQNQVDNNAQLNILSKRNWWHLSHNSSLDHIHFALRKYQVHHNSNHPYKEYTLPHL